MIRTPPAKRTKMNRFVLVEAKLLKSLINISRNDYESGLIGMKQAPRRVIPENNFTDAFPVKL